MPDEATLPLAPLLTQLGIMMTLALMVERFMTVFNWLIDRFFLIKAASEEDIAEKSRQRLALAVRAKQEENLLSAEPTAEAPSPPSLPEIEPNPDYAAPDSQFDIKALEPPRTISVLKEFWIQLLATLVAIAGCYYTKFSIWIFIRWAHDTSASFASLTAQPWEFVLTGIIIGAGSKPVNFLMNFLVTRKIIVTKAKVEPASVAPPASEKAPTTAAAAAQMPVAPHRSRTIEEIIGFDYDGGDRPARLEHTHRFRAPIDLIVYHHTAMHSDAPFEEVVKEFDRKGWLTGYNCIILKDGTIRVLCRWDRFGNHARGYNSRSLGVALHGNFEPDPKVPFSNFDGRFGILYPTQNQVDAMARVVALWAMLHNVQVTFPTKSSPGFPKGIVPHYALAPKACPGANFPHDTFRSRVLEYAQLWNQDAGFKSALEKFKAMPMVMAGGH